MATIGRPTTSFRREAPPFRRLTTSSGVAPCASRPMTTSLRDHPNAKRIASPMVRAKILEVIGKRLQPADVKDVMQEVYLRLFRVIDELPESDDELRAFTAVVTDGEVKRKLRKDTVRDGRHAGEEAAEAVAEPATSVSPHEREEFRRLYEYAQTVDEKAPYHADCLRWAQRLARGDEWADIARDEGIPESTLRKRMERFRKHMRQRWYVYSGLAGPVLVYLMVNHWRDEYPGVGAPNPHAMEPEATTSAPAPETPTQAASRLRLEAKTACDAHDFTKCESLLDAANRLDPSSNARPEVIDLRTTISRARSGAH